MQPATTGAHEDPTIADLSQLRRERDLYVRLLRLGEAVALEPFLREALALIVDVTGARQGYLELQGRGDEPRRWSIACGFSDLELDRVRAAISSGIIARALSGGQTVMTTAAMDDVRFRARDSVRLLRIGAVLCAPVGWDPPLGALYLQGRQRRAHFTDEDRATAELFTRHVAPLADRLLARALHAQADPTTAARARLLLDGVIGRSTALAALLRQIELVAPLDVTVLLTGDSGTGKSRMARVIHDNGPRRGGPFVEINCAALPDTLLESELFGAVRGAHSTALRPIAGKVAAADQGTLFLDEVAELAPGAQAKLLQLIQSRRYYPLGSAQPTEADVRVIAASNADLSAAVATRRFREDLYFRLAVVPMHLPTLAERREDLPLLAAHFAAEAAARHRLPQLPLSPNSLRVAQTAAWPGNVRQLAHAVEAAVIRAAAVGARQIERSHLFPSADEGAGGRPTLQEATRTFQARLLRQALEATDWNVVETARRLDLARSYVYDLIRAFGLERGHA